MSAVAAWSDVEQVIAGLAETHETFPTVLAEMNRIDFYEPGRRVQLASAGGPSWLEVDSIKECWQTFERLGRIRRRDVLEPGRCSAVMMALFARVPGVREEPGDEMYLVLTAR